MFHFSSDATKAEEEMHAIIFYLTTFGYIDGDFDAKERAFVKNYIARLVEERAKAAISSGDAALLRETTRKYTAHFHEVFEGIDQRIKDLLLEPVAKDEDPQNFVHAKLKLRCFEIFQTFDKGSQENLLKTIDDLVMADGEAHPAELEFRAELASLLDANTEIELVEDEGNAQRLEVRAREATKAKGETHPFFVPSEVHYSKEPERIAEQVALDRALLDRVIGLLDSAREKGNDRLKGKQRVDEFEGEGFLDGHTFLFPRIPGRTYELLVLGDLHGCYSVLKATLMQSRFFDKVDAFRKDPSKHPEPKLILLGDYIDRGLFSLNGVLRTVLQLYATAPDFVVPLRGNHEYYVELKGNIYGGVKPAESINTLKPHLPIDVFRHYSRLFEALPNVCFFDRFMFVHGGIARDRLLKERVHDLSGLNDPDVRFQMMWSDPSSADVVPADLQEKSSRFSFGRLQARAFLQRIGCHTLIRGHEKTNEGFTQSIDDGAIRLFTLFSAGGRDNDDLPADSSYRSVTPMALTIRIDGEGNAEMTPWAPDYKTYNDPSRNAFFRIPPEIKHRAE